MKNLFNIDTIRLKRNYDKDKKHSHRLVLEKLVLVAFHNDGFLPNDFEIPLKLTDSNAVTEVLNDLGYPHIRCVRCLAQDIHVLIGK